MRSTHKTKPYHNVLGQLNDLPDDNPFQSMYQRTHGNSGQKENRNSQKPRSQSNLNHQDKARERPQTSNPLQRNKSQLTVQKNGANSGQSRTPLRQNSTNNVAVVHGTRRYGQHGDSNHVEPQSVNLAEFGQTTRSKEKRLVPAGHHTDGRQTRCTDRFVRYAYPSNMRSKYAEQHDHKTKRTLINSHKNAFNLEKESKILNPSQMKQSLYTTNKKTYTGKQEKTVRPPEVVHEEPPKPCNKDTVYAKNFPNWANGKLDVFHEQHPQFPYYQLPHRGNSHYREQFTEEQRKAFLRQQEELKALTSKQAVKGLQLGTYASKPFTYATTNNEKLKDFRIAVQFVNDQPKFMSGADQPGKRVHQVVSSKSLPGHFRTTGQMTWVNHHENQNHQLNAYKRSQADFIPYP